VSALSGSKAGSLKVVSHTKWEAIIGLQLSNVDRLDLLVYKLCPYPTSFAHTKRSTANYQLLKHRQLFRNYLSNKLAHHYKPSAQSLLASAKQKLRTDFSQSSITFNHTQCSFHFPNREYSHQK
jgi:hypothetical protein